MDLIASFSSQKVNQFNFFVIHGLIGNDDLLFLFDTGAACSVIGVNSLFKKGGGSDGRMAVFKDVLRSEIAAQGIQPRPMKAANSQSIITYPCSCNDVSIENTTDRVFYFDISFDDINIPLLGCSFIDDCAYNHAINGNIVITGIKGQAGYSYYSNQNILDFNIVKSKYEQRLIS